LTNLKQKNSIATKVSSSLPTTSSSSSLKSSSSSASSTSSLLLLQNQQQLSTSISSNTSNSDTSSNVNSPNVSTNILPPILPAAIASRPPPSMNLELVPCMFKSRAGDGKESEVVGFMLRTPGSINITGTSITTTQAATPIASKPVVKQPKIQPRRSDPVIAPRKLDSGPPKILPATSANGIVSTAKILPAPLTTSLSNGSIATSNAQKGLGIGSFIELPLTAFGQGATTVVPTSSAPPIITTAKAPPKPRSRSTKAKSKVKPVEEIPPSMVLQAPPSLPSTSFEMQSPPQLLPETNGSFLQNPSSITPVSSSPPSYLPPISAITHGGIESGSSPSTSGYSLQEQQQQQQLISANGCTSDDIRAIEIAHSLSNDQKARNEYWSHNPHSQHSSSHEQQYYAYDSTYMFPQQQQQPSSSHSGQPGYHSYPQASSDYNSHEQPNGYGNYSHQHQQNCNNGHHSNNHWIQQQQPPRPQPLQQQQQQQQYHGVNNNQMTSSTPDSGIQSIDGSPPSTSAFTPPMVSPYPIQTNHFDPNLTQTTMTVSALQQQLPLSTSSTTQFSAGPMGSSSCSSIRTRLSSEGPQSQSHIHLPPLNCMLPSASQPTSQSISTSSRLISDKSYLDQQQPSCSYQNSAPLICETELDDIRIDPVQSISPPGLEDEKLKDYDSDCDYSDMPILVRGDIISKEPVEKESEVDRTASRISTTKSMDEEKKKEEPPPSSQKLDNSVAIAINPNMDANEIAKMLMSSLPSEKVQELLRSFRPAIEEKEEDNAQEKFSNSKVIPPNEESKDEELQKEETKEDVPPVKKASKPRRSRKQSTATTNSSGTPQQISSGNERPSTRSSTRNSSPPRIITPPPAGKKCRKTKKC
jgi:hypothetical protein